MKKVLILTVVLAGAVGMAQAQGTVVYDNLVNLTYYFMPQNYFPLTEQGDHVNLASTERCVTQIQVNLVNPYNVGGTADVTFRLYDGDPGLGGPLVWSSVVLAYNFTNNSQFEIVLPVTPSVGLTQNDCTVTMQFANMTGDPSGTGYWINNPPVVGTSEDWFYVNSGGTWSAWWFGGNPVANFSIKVWADPCGPAGCRGDTNCDGKIDFADIDPFVAVLSGGTCCDGTGYNCDVDGNGQVDFNDIDPFVALLSSGATCP